MPSNVGFKRDTALLQCVLCQRRIGLWAFAPQPSTADEPSCTERRDLSGTDPAMEYVNAADPAAARPATSSSKKTATQRQFDLLKEHRSYCPYVVRSTVVPTLPVPPPPNSSNPTNAHLRSNSSGLHANSQNTNLPQEGWRAVLTVVLRYGAGQRQRLGLDFADRLRGRDGSDESVEVDEVKAMVAGVKNRGASVF